MKHEDPRPDPTPDVSPESDSGAISHSHVPRWTWEGPPPGTDAAPRESEALRSAMNLAEGFFESVDRLQPVLDTAAQALTRLTRHPEEPYIGDLVGRFASWVMDLPASGRYHHPGPYGLLLHSSEVAAETVRDLEVRWCQNGGGRVLSPEDRALWSRVAFALGLYHDCGKILDAEVQGPSGSRPWNPLAEPLASYKVRQGLPLFEKTPFCLRRGRERYDHEMKGGALVPLLLADTEGERIRPQVEAAWTAFISRHLPLSRSLPPPLAFLADRVHRADCRSARLGEKWHRAQDTPSSPSGLEIPREDSCPDRTRQRRESGSSSRRERT